MGLAAEPRRDACALLREASLELARLRRVRGAYRETARRIRRAQARLAFAAGLLAVTAADPAAAGTPMFRHGFIIDTRVQGSYLHTPTFSDLDGDGDLDVLVGNSFGNTLFFENTGTAVLSAFAAPSTNPFGLADIGFNASPTFADLDGDGDLDAFLGEIGGNTLFFENTGAATAPAFAALTVNPFGLADVGLYSAPDFADIDGDGDFDAFVGARSVGYVSVLFFENTGTASTPALSAPTAQPFGLEGDLYRGSPSFADIDGDGDLDALVAGQNGEVSRTIAFENTGTASTPAFTSAGNPFGLTAPDGDASTDFADIDGDGDLDLFLGAGYSSLYFFRNLGTASAPSFGRDPINPFGLVGNDPNLADIDSDGDLDAFLGIPSGDTTFFENTGTAGTPAFAGPSTNPFGLADVGSYAAPDFANIDGDGDLDAFVGSFTGNTLFLRNTGNATAPDFAVVSINPFGLLDVGSYASPDFADIDGDGDLDAFVGDSNGGMALFENTGTASAPAFIQPQLGIPGLTPVGRYESPDFADIDGDGDLDALVGNIDGRVVFFKNSGTPSAPYFTTPFGSNPFGLFADEPQLADIDADGDLDAFVGNFGSTLFFRNTGSATAPDFAAPTVNPFGLADVGYFGAPAFADVDGDGDLDAFVGNGGTMFFENTGTVSAPAFGAPVANPFGLVGTGGASLDFGDLDGDGDLDLFVGDYLGRIFSFENVAIDPDACTDGIDNDSDGQLDLAADPGCASAADTSELGSAQCDNGQDDDGDWKTDWRGDASGDPHCASLTDNREAPDPPTGCGLGPELLLLVPLLAAVRRRRGSYTAPSCPSPTPPPTSSSSAAR